MDTSFIISGSSAMVPFVTMPNALVIPEVHPFFASESIPIATRW